MATAEAGRARARVGFPGSGTAAVATGIPVLDHLLVLSARRGALDLEVEVAPGEAASETAACGRALGDALGQALGAEGVRGAGSGHGLADEALAQVVLEASGRPLVVSNVDLSAARVAGLGTDVVAGFLHALAEEAGLTLHVRLIEGTETEHVLDAIFKALGAALGEALSTT
ncbi:MAG: imidazoleglycerol-phosphate dehydratase [Thermoleophilia bacterium]|nr:imidazoleglycerol-phosphate dehydratase [Thermoleophilia bacterium]